MVGISYCNKCKHKLENKGFQMCCHAFPNGIPYSFNDDNVKKIKECNNGIGYEDNECNFHCSFV